MTDLLVARSGSWVKYSLPSVPISNRDALVAGTYKPGPSTTGVLPGIARTSITAPTQLPGGGFQPATTYSNMDFNFIFVPPTGTSTIVFRNCSFLGPTTPVSGTTTSLAKVWDPGRCPTEYYDCTFRAQAPSQWINAINGHHFKLYRCNLYNVIDGSAIFNTNDPDGPTGVVIQQCWIHDNLWYPPGLPGTSAIDGSHNDGIQPQGGSGTVIVGNNIENYCDPNFFNTYYGISQGNAAMQIKPDVGLMTGYVVEQNWFSGGRIATINFAHDDPDRFIGNFGTFKRNIFLRDSAAEAREIIRPSTVVPTIDFGTGTTVATTNVYSDTMVGPVTISPGAG